MPIKVLVEKLDESFELPYYKTAGSACFDLKFQTVRHHVSCVTHGNVETQSMISLAGHLIIMPGDRVLVPTGLKMQIKTPNPNTYSIRLFPRSGLSFKSGLTLINGVGVVDSDYQEEIFIPLVNNSHQVTTIKLGDRIAQGEIIKNSTASFVLASKVERTTDRIGGFGSTGVA